VKVKDFLGLYTSDSLFKSAAYKIFSEEKKKVKLKGLTGSLDAVTAAALYKLFPRTMLFIMHDKEEAQYFLQDLQNLLEGKEILLFPSSYKKIYQFEHVENANVLLRAEVLSRVNHGIKGEEEIIVTYPESLSEKVINRRSLIENTFTVKLGENLDMAFLEEMLLSYDFEKTDFVLEAGQFAVRGGIIDVFSYANDLPYRIELFGDEIESIRIFNPDSQLSVENKKSFSLVPNVQTRLLQEMRESLLKFLPADTAIWVKDLRQTLDIIGESFEKVSQSFADVVKSNGGNKLITDPAELFEKPEFFEKHLKDFSVLEFGKQYYLSQSEEIVFKAKPQPSFNKEFKLLVEDLNENQTAGFVNFIAAESHKQIERISAIVEELDPIVKFQALNISLREGFWDENLKLACYTDHQVFDRFHSFRSKEKYSKSKAITLRELRALHPGDFVTHADHGIARFAGLEKLEVNNRQQEAIRLVFRDDDLMLVSIHQLHKISKYSGKEGGAPTLSKLGSAEWEQKKTKVKKQVRDIAKELIQLYAKRKAAPGYAFSGESFLQVELESSFLYEDTPDQAKATADVKADMELPHPMDRLVCGDVGFGKTEIAIRAAFKAVCDNKQVAVLVPTTILAMQHYKTFKERLDGLPCVVEYVNRFKTTQQIKETLKRVAEGKTNILIGTHRLISKDVKFKELGLLVIDEEQKFGVKVKEKLKDIKIDVDTLTLTATPIPRTLHFSLMGARDLSIIATPPPNRQPVTTEIHTFNDEIIRDSISYELKRGGQVFMVHNRIKDIEGLADRIIRLVPDAKVGIAHGQMEGELLEKMMMKFVEGEFDVLVSTNIIESGLDIPNANTIIINMAHMFGLSDLHQMRGRVGRSNKKAFCYLLTPPVSTLPSDSRKRLSALEEFSDLGDGFKVAMRDLDIRGAGNLLGAEQSGFINDIGFEMYHKILDEAVQELKETEFKDLFQSQLSTEAVKSLVNDCVIETDMAVVVPDNYVANISERLSLYNTLDNLKNREELDNLRNSVTDRFGPMPKEVEDLFETVRLRWRAEKLGFEKVTLRNETLRCYFVTEHSDAYFKSDVFGNILRYVQQHSKTSRLKEINKKPMLILEDIEDMGKALEVLENMLPEGENSIEEKTSEAKMK
jgi:transcription-repair coupling factor (superfamily II helicase)